MINFHIYHIVKTNPYPIVASFGSLNLALSFLFIFNYRQYQWVLMRIVNLIILSFLWWDNILKESNYEGCHGLEAKNILALGILLFIISELCFFVSFFWTFTHFSLNPGETIGLFPPLLLNPFNPLLIPLLNTLLLISSGCSLTIRHHYLILNHMVKRELFLVITITLGITFSILQLFEYIRREFSINISCYGRIFYISTGFHGLHVLIGRLFLLWNLINIKYNSCYNHLRFEISIWYWHFVDVIWLVLYRLIYWWRI